MSTVCETATTRADGRLDLVGCFHQLQAPGFPAAQDRLTAVFVIEWNDEESGQQPLRADLVDDEGTRILTIEGHTDVAAETGGAAPQTRLIMPIENVVFPHAGHYHFELVIGGDMQRGCSIHVGRAGADGSPPDPS